MGLERVSNRRFALSTFIPRSSPFDAMFPLAHFWRQTKTQFLVLTLCLSPCFSEIFGYTALRQLSQMLLAIIFFHISEYFLAVSIHGRQSVTFRSLLISKHYVFAMVCSLLEYLLEITFFPTLKEYWWLSNFGLAMVVTGEIIRKMAILTAGRAFTHLIKIQHEEHHKLVKHGIYGIVRHPGYCGFSIWSIGTQVMLLNPISAVAFAIVVWHFFAERIPYEEHFLRQFFGAEYEEYARRVTSGIPFVK
ncbi:hypothetical protein Nepgr_018237 [Nepenthes gracilis]|uniref:Protein-S-isoprenylcysteine O-methyltransferase n=1 Tax=Nepenthes gracilis TaxID=150966 RepID=A0AAD3XU44_NEPGR|nr:hypothetical protein Nepgr_018237 [Nepenthes gracilis]